MVDRLCSLNSANLSPRFSSIVLHSCFPSRHGTANVTECSSRSGEQNLKVANEVGVGAGNVTYEQLAARLESQRAALDQWTTLGLVLCDLLDDELRRVLEFHLRARHTARE
jgi:hypothetical protein